MVYRGISSIVFIHSHKAGTFCFQIPSCINESQYPTLIWPHSNALIVCPLDMKSSPHASEILGMCALRCVAPTWESILVALLLCTCGFNLSHWRFQHQSKSCIIYHLLMSHRWKTALIFPRPKIARQFVRAFLPPPHLQSRTVVLVRWGGAVKRVGLHIFFLIITISTSHAQYSHEKDCLCCDNTELLDFAVAVIVS